MLKNLNVVSSEYAPKDTSCLWIKKEDKGIGLYWNDGLKWVNIFDSIAGKSVIGSIPDGVRTTGTSKEFFKSLQSEYDKGNIEMNGLYCGGVMLSDLPCDMTNAEAVIKVINNGSDIPIFNVEITTVETKSEYSPFKWDYSSRFGDFTKWYGRNIVAETSETE